jgi:type I restriction enzyme S subunit
MNRITLFLFLEEFRNAKIDRYGKVLPPEVEKRIADLHTAQLLAITLIRSFRFSRVIYRNFVNPFCKKLIQGKLVPQDPNDESASELLRKIKAEKEQLIAKGNLKKEKPLPPITPEEIPFELPIRMGVV